MIRALIVDDEVLIRRGLALTLPWAKYGIEIAGEAGSALQALEFLENNPVELLITDITMPNMSGIELVETVNSRYPEIFVVIITCHQDFNYLQKVMRLGVLDYIVKTQIEDEEIEENLKRISDRINSERHHNREHNWIQPAAEKDTGVLIIHNSGNIAFLNSETKICISDNLTLYLVASDKAETVKKMVSGEVPENIAVCIKSISCINQEKLLSTITNYVNNSLFYDYNSVTKYYEIDASDFDNSINSVDNEKINLLKREWNSILWIFNESEFERLKINTTRVRPDSAKLKNMLYKAVMEWEMFLFIAIPAKYEEMLESARFWEDYEKWLTEIKGFVNSKSNNTGYPEDTVNIVVNSIEYIKTNFSKEINQEFISKMFNISRGYFSKVFKDITGSNFTDYMKNLRIKKAKSLLIQTNKPIYIIAEEIGFLDEKYFSRIFKENTGYLPAEYRNNNRPGKEDSLRQIQRQ